MGRPRMVPAVRRGARAVAGLLAAALVLTACGSRISEDERAFVLGSAAGAPGAGPGVGGGGGVGDDGTLPDAGEAFALPDDPDDGAVASEAPDGAGDGGGAAGGERAGGEGGSGEGGGEGQASEAAGSRDTRAAPPGGNGGATDTGVTEDRIVIANVVDIAGPVPGIFEDAQKGAAAYLAYFAAREGTVYGRKPELLPLDSRLDSGQARQHYLRACEQAFGAAGSMSALEEGAADPVASCGIPDMRAVVTSAAMQQVPNAWGIEVQRVGQMIGTPFRYWAEQHPEAIERSAYLFIENETTRFQTTQNRRATETIGYRWLINQPIQIAETNYDGFVLDMKREDIRFVTFQGEYSQAVRLAQAMRRQNYWPEVYGLQPNIYTPKLIQAGGAAVEGAQVYISTAMVEEIDRNEEMQTYRQWLKQVDPQAEPSYIGTYGWSAMKLFIEGLKEIGPRPTRAKMREFLAGITGWDGDGLHAAFDVGPKRVRDCSLVMEVRDGRFVRVEPAKDGWRCAKEPLRVPS